MPKVAWVSRKNVVKIKEPTNVISINSPHDASPVFGCNHKKLLSLRFNPFGCGTEKNLADPELCRKVFEFLESCDGEDIVVHCGEGRIRSPAIAMFITDAYDRIDPPAGGEWIPDFDHPGRECSEVGMDRKLYWLLQDEWVKYHAEKESVDGLVK